MKKQLLNLSLLIVVSQNLKSQVVIDTVSIGTGYANHKYYSLQNDEQGTQSKDNWDLAFEITGYTSAILANTQRVNFALYRAPYSIANYAGIDTAGISAWPTLYNSDTTWATGALNRTASPSNSSDLGWGLYDLNTHYITGDSCYVVKISPTSYKKLKIVSLIGGVYTFEYANINGTSSQTATITKANYVGKNFAYFDLSSNAVIDREPISVNWDLMFGRYTAFVPTPYPVVGVLSNKGVKVAQMNDVPNPATFNAWSGVGFSSNISTIGNDWKAVDISTNAWKITGDTIYLISDRSGNIWKMRFTAFGGTTNGNYIFSKEKLSATGIADVKGNISAKVALYPNPSVANTILAFSTEESVSDLSVSVIDMAGNIVSSENIKVESGLNQKQLNTESLNSGVYIISLNAGSYHARLKLIKQ